MKNIKPMDIALLALVVGGGYLIYKEVSKPPVPAQVPGGPSYADLLAQGNSQSKAQNILAWIQYLTSTGLSVYQAIAQANAQTDAGNKPPEWNPGGGVGASGGCWYNINEYMNLCDGLSAAGCHNVI